MDYKSWRTRTLPLPRTGECVLRHAASPKIAFGSLSLLLELRGDLIASAIVGVRLTKFHSAQLAAASQPRDLFAHAGLRKSFRVCCSVCLQARLPSPFPVDWLRLHEEPSGRKQK